MFSFMGFSELFAWQLCCTINAKERERAVNTARNEIKKIPGGNGANYRKEGYENNEKKV